MRHTGSRMYARPAPVPQMPPGLVQLMEGLTRDVLQHNPANVYEFCARHMEQLLIIRDGAAPTKKRLTLEQKIKRAQEKVREKAEQRRRKFDEDIKKYQPDVLEAESLSAKEEKETESGAKQEKETESGAKQETEQSIAISNEAQNDLKEIVKSTESALETKLKAPVHHEQDLAEALEVEIFHKPVDEGLNLKATEARDLNNIPVREINELDTKLIESIKNDEVLKESNSMDSKDNENLANSDDTDHVNDSLEQVIISETILNDSHDHVRTRRSVDIEENYKSKSETLDENDVTKIVEEQNNTTENADELKSVQEENTVAETVDHSEISNNEDNVNSVEVSNGNQIDTELKDNITKTAHLELDSATAFAFEMCEVKSTPETVHNDPVQAANENVSEDKTKLPAELENKIVSTSIISPNESITIEDITSQEESMKKNVNDEAKVIDNNILRNDNSEQALSSEVEIANNNKNENDLGLTENNVSRNEVATNEISLDNDDSEKNYTINEKLESTAHLNETELKEDDTTIVKETTEDKKMLDQNSEITDSQKDETEKVHIDLEKEKILNTDDKIIEAIEQLEVCTEPIESSLNDTIESLEVHGNMETENNIKVNEANKEVLTEDGADENRSISEGNSHGTITSVDKVLVEESSGINDDNDSAPEQQIIENDLHMNGTHEIISGIMENGNDSPEPHIISAEDVPPNEDIPKVVDITPEVHDDVTNTSDPIKTDPEVSSLGKSSSMDSFIEEVVDTITEVDEMKPTTAKTAQNKEASSMDLETAAITIQKVFRTFLFKSRESTFDESGRGNSIDGDNETTEVEFPVTSAPLNKERRTLGISRMDTVLQTVNEEKSLSLSTDDSSLSSAATIIQAHVRGFLTRNRLNSNKTNSSSLVNSDAPSSTSLENDLDQKANKTVLNIHIVPEGEHFLSRDESLLTSMELSLDGSPPSSTNLHPLGYDKNEPRKQLKREDAIQSVSPPSNNSGKLSEDIDSVKDMPIIDSEQQKVIENTKDETRQDLDIDRDDTPTKSTTIETVIEAYKLTNESSSSPEPEKEDVKTTVQRKRSLANISSDECDVVTPFEEKSATDSDASSRLLHSGEFHDIVLPTKVSRGDTSVVREFKNVLVYFLIWNNS